MHKSNCLCMERLTRNIFKKICSQMCLLPFQSIPCIGSPSIGRIAENRMIDVRQMHANLMCSAGLEMEANKRKKLKFFQNFIFCNSRFSFFCYCDFFPVALASAKVCIDRPFRRFETSPDYRPVPRGLLCAWQIVLQEMHAPHRFLPQPLIRSYLYPNDAQSRDASRC